MAQSRGLLLSVEVLLSGEVLLSEEVLFSVEKLLSVEGSISVEVLPHLRGDMLGVCPESVNLCRAPRR